MNDYVGEILESSTREIMAECKLDTQPPPLGTLIKINTKPMILGIVYNVFTYCIEAGRRPTAYGLTAEELQEEQPQIFELLKTGFQAVIVGFYEDDTYYQFSPPLPPPLHSFAYICGEDEIRIFTEEKDFIRVLLTTNKGQSDEIIISFIRQAWIAHKKDQNVLIDFGKELSILLKDDYDRLKSIMKRIIK